MNFDLMNKLYGYVNTGQWQMAEKLILTDPYFNDIKLTDVSFPLNNFLVLTIKKGYSALFKTCWKRFKNFESIFRNLLIVTIEANRKDIFQFILEHVNSIFVDEQINHKCVSGAILAKDSSYLMYIVTKGAVLERMKCTGFCDRLQSPLLYAASFDCKDKYELIVSRRWHLRWHNNDEQAAENERKDAIKLFACHMIEAMEDDEPNPACVRPLLLDALQDSQVTDVPRPSVFAGQKEYTSAQEVHELCADLWALRRQVLLIKHRVYGQSCQYFYSAVCLYRDQQVPSHCWAEYVRMYVFEAYLNLPDNETARLMEDVPRLFQCINHLLATSRQEANTYLLDLIEVYTFFLKKNREPDPVNQLCGRLLVCLYLLLRQSDPLSCVHIRRLESLLFYLNQVNIRAGLCFLHMLCLGSQGVNAMTMVKHAPFIEDMVRKMLLNQDNLLVRTIRLVLQSGANVDCCDGHYNTPLLLASYNHVAQPVIDTLLQHGAHSDYINLFGLRAIDYLSPGYQFKCIKLTCLAARVIKRNRINTEQLPGLLAFFVARH